MLIVLQTDINSYPKPWRSPGVGSYTLVSICVVKSVRLQGILRLSVNTSLLLHKKWQLKMS